MILTKQQALQALNKNKFIGFTITNGNIIMKKINKTDYNIFVYEEDNDTPMHYVGKKEFPELEETNFKGALKAKYGTGCKLIDKSGIHF